MKDYKPSPLDTSDVVLPDELLALAETLAENVHEVWAQGRESEGWTYGPERDDHARKHPGLRPYAELSEEEKDYDRRTSRETLKMIVKLGFEIVKK